jgi:hypothetical protein
MSMALADVSLVQTGAIRKLLARGRSFGRLLEEAGPMADVHHEGQHAAGVVAEQFSRELLHALAIRRPFHIASCVTRHHPVPRCPSTWEPRANQ